MQRQFDQRRGAEQVAALVRANTTLDRLSGQLPPATVIATREHIHNIGRSMIAAGLF